MVIAFLGPSFDLWNAVAGNCYEVITASNGNMVGNFSLVSTPVTSNVVVLMLPPTFNARQLLPTGSYTAVVTCFTTTNFTEPMPLTITFTISVRTIPLLLRELRNAGSAGSCVSLVCCAWEETAVPT